MYAPNGPSEFFLARYTASGTLDGSFQPASGMPAATAPAGVVFTAFDPTSNAGAASLVQLPDGTFVAGGSAGTSFALARYWGDNSPPAYALATANAVYVNLLYQQLLGRPVDQPGLSGWVAWLAQGAARSQVALGIEQSPEYRTRLVDGFYSTLLGRPADPAGQAGFVSALGAGMTVEQVQAIILGSAEYAQRAGGSDTAFLQAVYHDILGRPLDSASAAGWSTALA